MSSAHSYGLAALGQEPTWLLEFSSDPGEDGNDIAITQAIHHQIIFKFLLSHAHALCAREKALARKGRRGTERARVRMCACACAFVCACVCNYSDICLPLLCGLCTVQCGFTGPLVDMVDQLSPQVNVVDQHMDLAPLFDRLLEAVDVTKLAVNGGEVVRMLLFYGRRVTHAATHAATH